MFDTKLLLFFMLMSLFVIYVKNIICFNIPYWPPVDIVAILLLLKEAIFNILFLLFKNIINSL